MKILAIETTGKYGSASVIDDEGRIWSAESREEMNHLKGIISLIDEALKAAIAAWLEKGDDPETTREVSDNLKAALAATTCDNDVFEAYEVLKLCLE